MKKTDKSMFIQIGEGEQDIFFIKLNQITALNIEPNYSRGGINLIICYGDRSVTITTPTKEEAIEKATQIKDLINEMEEAT